MYVLFKISKNYFMSTGRGNNTMLKVKCKKVTVNAKYLINWTLELKKSLIYNNLSELLTIKYFQKLLNYY